ncbi:hypothetical protein BKA62DRAFT_457202 [Auriculariales sp. MPI-PUGE-AT-0066]|nr:hypothetical protein BKA62DRAFT_457202 [Auriculariales sp. MPI-PUGE-AT-0066]
MNSSADSSREASPTTSPADSRSGSVKPVTLGRGEACLPCRKRKLRCDAARPACERCGSLGQGSRCEYRDSRYLSAIAALEDTVQALQTRLQNIEGSSVVSRHVEDFTNPTATQSIPLQDAQFGHFVPMGLREPTIASIAATIASDRTAQTPIPNNFAYTLLTSFERHSSQFFIPPIVTNRVFSSFGEESALRLHPALLEVALAVGAHFLQDPTSAPEDHRTLTSALILRAESLLAVYNAQAPGQESLQIIQGLVILGGLQMLRCRPVDGHRLMGGAMRLARALGVATSTAGGDDEKLATWQMLKMLDWTWSGVCRIPCETVTTLARSPDSAQYTPELERLAQLSLLARVHALHAYVQVLLLDPPPHCGHARWNAEFAPCIHLLARTSSDCDAYAGSTNWELVQAKVIAEGMLLVINSAAVFAGSALDNARAISTGIHTLSGAGISDWTVLNPAVGFYLVHTERVLASQPPALDTNASVVTHILDSLMPSMPFLGTIRKA